MNLENTSVLITGAGRGLGKALAIAFANHGARVVCVARTLTEIESVVSEITGKGGKAVALQADISDKNQIYPLVGAATALVGPIDILIHNAATLGVSTLRSLMDTDCEDLEYALEVNVLGPFRLTKALAGAMSVRNHGVIIHVTTDAAVEAYPTWGVYGVTKSALEHLGKSFAVELAENGIKIINVDPGEMDTALHHQALPQADRTTLTSPIAVAEKIVTIVKTSEQYPSGSRVVAATVQDHQSEAA